MMNLYLRRQRLVPLIREEDDDEVFSPQDLPEILLGHLAHFAMGGNADPFLGEEGVS